MITRSISILFFLITACNTIPDKAESQDARNRQPVFKQIAFKDPDYKNIHVFVALCDNKYQGIVPVPAKLGVGQETKNNLYWGSAYGVKTYFKNSADWQLIRSQQIDSTILERLVFKHRNKKVYLVADAYNGKLIKRTMEDLLHSCAGQVKDTLKVNGKTIAIAGNAQLLAYIGHDGLMDMRLTSNFKNNDGTKRDCIILACISKKYFSDHVAATKAHPLIWTTGLMCPEAYTLHDAITGYINNETPVQIQQRAAKAYAKYQKCTVGFANKLLVTGH